MQLKRVAIYVALAFAPGAYAGETSSLPEVQVKAEKLRSLPSGDQPDGGDLVRLRTNTSDTAKLLDGQPGVSLYGAGGVSSLPVIHGMADDRVRVKVDGMDLISSCANHMNPPLSYIDPASIGNIEVFAGIAPVSLGGDSIGGTIRVNSAAPEFAAEGERLLKGQAGIFYRSNGNAKSGNATVTLANENTSVSYTGSTAEADDYKAGAAFKAAGAAATGRGWLDGDEVGSSMYKSTNQSLGFAMRRDAHLVELKLGFQDIAQQGFPNQRMDMTGNDSTQINLRYAGQYDWGVLEARVYHEDTRHKMQFGDDKQFLYGTAPGMPMDTDGNNTGATLKGDVILSERDLLRIGAEYQRYRLDDWWLPSGTGGMSPNTFQNINGGKRDRFDVFGEWEARWNAQWMSQLGARLGSVRMDTGTVQGYKTTATYTNDATPFNTLNRQRADDNLDLTALARYTPDTGKTFEAGYAMKTRSPNLYERYTWSAGSTMVLNMNNWFGDGNGYVGNPDLKPEVAHTLSATGSWHDGAQGTWELKLTPYYTHIDNYIDAVACAATATHQACPARTDGFVNLSLGNQSARIYGVDVSGRMPLARDTGWGSFSASGVLNYADGKNLTTGDNLYNIMPLNAKLAVEQRFGSWVNTAELKLVDAKTQVQAMRKELRTGGYGLLNLYASREWKQLRLDLGIENLFDKFYYEPLGGAYVGQGATMSTGVSYGTGVPGKGRSINAGLTMKF